MDSEVPPVECLIVVDVQRGFVEGPHAVPDAERLVGRLSWLLSQARRAGAFVVHLQNDGPAGAVDQPGTPGWELLLAAGETGGNEVVIRKSSDDGFAGTDLGELLDSRGVRRVAIGGLLSEMCVSATARAALARGLSVVVARDAHGTYDLGDIPAAVVARVAEHALGDTLELTNSAQVGFIAAEEDAAVQRLRRALSLLAEQTRARTPDGTSHHDADDSVGTFGTDDAIGFDPLPLLRALHERGAEAVVIGQVAGIMHGSLELTGDLDLLWDGGAEQAKALAAAFASVSAELTDDGGRPLPCEPASFGLPKVLFRAAGASGDCCTPALPWGDLPVAEFLTRCRIAAAGGFAIRYLDRADLIRMRRAAGRIKDLRRADELENADGLENADELENAAGLEKSRRDHV
ncbi:MAG TPA: isochorismatase family protein [Candidatus Limnocylindrales bacterium]